MVGEAFTFSGSSAYIQIPDSASLELTNQLTLELWYKDTGCPSGNHFYGLLGKRAPYPSGANFGISLYLGGPSYLQVYLQDPNYAGYQASTSPLPPAGVFHHVAATYSQVTPEQVEARTYVDGQLASVGVLSGNLARTLNHAPVTLGSPNGFESFFVGLIDEPTIYRRALSAPEILAIYNASVSGKCQTPFPPTIYSQPANQAVFVGQTASFAVSASGTAPLSYQWSFDGTNLPGATTASLLLTNVQAAQSGNYSVLVTNAVGAVLSSNALLAVNPPPPCATPASGLVSWWRGEGDASDFFGGNKGAILSGITFIPGEVGQAFNFDGNTGAVIVPQAPNLQVQSFTIEAWIKPTDISIPRPILEYGDPGQTSDVELWYSLNPGGVDVPGALYGIVREVNINNYLQLATAGGLVWPNQWTHVGFTFDFVTRTAALFVNGTNVATRTSPVPIQPNTTNSVNIGLRPVGSADVWSGRRHAGGLDEVSIYARALSGKEIQAIYNASIAGKCTAPVQPAIYSQPADQMATVGNTASFSVGVSGTQPLNYQWSFNGSIIPGATNASLVLANVQRSQAGNYAVQVTNAVGSATSSNAVLTVNFPPATIQAVTTTASADGSVVLPVDLIANGNENALGFSLDFSPSLLTYTNIALGSGATGAGLIVNTNQAGNGQLGVALSLPAGSTFSAGIQEVVEVRLVASALTNTAAAQVTFGDQPVGRQLADSHGNPLLATYSGTSVLIPAAAFEGDVWPRPNGDKVVTISDWVLEGRYAARLDYPTNASEYQRADCAPRSTLGDGAITVADWVQVGRYAAGLDPATRAGGPTNDLGPNMVLSAGEAKLPARNLLPHTKGLNPRQIKAANSDLAPGEPSAVSVLLEAQGNENALGFSLAFDPTVFTYTSACLGAGAGGATIEVNASQAGSGRLAVVLALPTGTSFPAGTSEVVRVNLRPKSSALGVYPLSLTDQPVTREVVDPTATPLTADFMNANITVNPLPVLSIHQAPESITLSWPLWATNFTLQGADGALFPSLHWTNLPTGFVITNSEASVTLPLRGQVSFYRLQK